MTEVVVERCGTFSRVLENGCHCLIPFMDRKVEYNSIDIHVSYDQFNVVQSFISEHYGE